MSSNPVHGEVYSIQHYVIKFVSDLRQVGGFHQVNIHTIHVFMNLLIYTFCSSASAST